MSIFKKNNLACLLVLFECIIHILAIIFRLDKDSKVVLIVNKDKIWKADIYIYMKSSDAKASKSHLKFSSLMMIFIKLVYLS